MAEDLLEKTISQLNEKFKKIKNLNTKYSDTIECVYKSILKETESYPYLKKLTYLTELNDSIQIP